MQHFEYNQRHINMENVWNKIPLEDYELHMQHESVGQLHLLNNLTKKYLEKLSPKTIVFLGIAGGMDWNILIIALLIKYLVSI